VRFIGGRSGYPFEHTIKKDSVYQTIKVRETTDVNDSKNTIQKDFEVYQNYPNPFNPSTTIEYNLPKSGNVILSIYNVLGQEVYKVYQKNVSAGTHYFKNIDFSGFPSGAYIYKVSSGNKTEIKKMILLK